MTAPVLQEPDRPASRKVLALLLAGLVFSGFCLLVAWALWWERLQRLSPGPPPPAVEAPATILGVEQTLFRTSQPGLSLRQRQQLELRTFTWADRNQGLVRLPIDVAMELSVARGNRP